MFTSFVHACRNKQMQNMTNWTAHDRFLRLTVGSSLDIHPVESGRIWDVYPTYLSNPVI